jgi:hypothetical protein
LKNTQSNSVLFKKYILLSLYDSRIRFKYVGVFLKEFLFLAIVEDQVQQGKQPNKKPQKQRKFTTPYL